MAFDANSGSDFIVLLFFVLIAAVLATRILAWNYVKGLLASGWSMAQGHVELGRSFHQYHEGPNDLHPIPSKPSGKVGSSPA